MSKHHTRASLKSKSPSEGGHGVLYVVATPIGNLGDITYRAVETLKSVDVIACEDTRVTQKLLNHFGIKAQTISYNDHNGQKQRPYILSQLEQGKSVALVSDAGTPLISDPGYKLVVELQQQGVSIIPIPGVSSVITALSVCGLPTDQFTFAGFLPNKDKARREAIEVLAAIDSTLVFLESPARLVDALNALMEGLGDREAVVARELTKLHEEVNRDSLSNLVAYYEAHPPKGEIVLLVAPPQQKEWQEDEIDALIDDALKTMRVKEAATHVATLTGLSKSDLYQRALERKK